MSKAIESLSPEDKATLKTALGPIFGDELASALSDVGYRREDTLADREAIALGEREYGLQVYVAEDELNYIWLPNDWSAPENDPHRYEGNDWKYPLTQEKIPGLTGTIATLFNNINATAAGAATGDNILQGQVDTLDDSVGDVLARLNYMRGFEVASFALTPSVAEVGDTVTSVAAAWSFSGGGPSAQAVRHPTGSAWWLRGADRAATIPGGGGAAPTAALFAGDSLSFYTYGPALAAALGLTAVHEAVYAQGSRKTALRLGAYSITVTLPGDILPASGTPSTVSTMNGGPTTIANADAILHAHEGDPTTDGHLIDGTLYGAGGASRQVTIAHYPATAPDVYSIVSAGGASMTVPPGSLFVPAFKAMMQTHALFLLIGHNSMSGSDPVGAFAGIRADTDAIMALRGNNPTCLMLFWPGIAELAMIPYIKAHARWMKRKYPGAYMIDPTTGLDVYEWLLTRGSMTGQDAIDRAAGAIPSSQTTDGLHLTGPATDPATGYGALKIIAQNFYQGRMAATMAVTADTTFALEASDGNAPDGAAATVTASARLSFLHRRYWGVGSGATLNSAGVVALTSSELSNDRASAFSVTAADQYVWFAYPASLGDPASYKLFGFTEAPTKTTVSVTKANGAVVSYALLRSANKLTGSVSVEVL